MLEHLVFHVGTHKTGTTSIQAALKASSEQLRRHGILYPHVGRGPLSGHHNFVWGRKGRARHRPDLGSVHDLARETRAAGARVVVLSSETFTDGPQDPDLVGLAEEIGRELDAPEITVHAYVRPQWDYIESNYVQLARRGHTARTFEEHVEASLVHWRFDYERVFGLWREHFGDRLKVRPYCTEIVDRFWEDVPELSDVPKPLSDFRRNVRSGRLIVGMMRYLRHLLEARGVPPEQMRNATSEALDFLKSVVTVDERFRGLSDAVVNQILETFRERNVRFVEDYFTDDSGLDLLTPGREYEPNEWSLDEATDDERAVLERMLSHVVKDA